LLRSVLIAVFQHIGTLLDPTYCRIQAFWNIFLYAFPIFGQQQRSFSFGLRLSNSIYALIDVPRLTSRADVHGCDGSKSCLVLLEYD